MQPRGLALALIYSGLGSPLTLCSRITRDLPSAVGEANICRSLKELLRDHKQISFPHVLFDRPSPSTGDLVLY